MSEELADTVVALRAFVPAKNFQISKNFYRDLGFQIQSIADDFADVRLDDFSFILQDFYVEEWASNFMMHLLVTDVDTWWQHINAVHLVAKYGVQPPRPPELKAWGAKVAYVYDPSGVLWHVAERVSTKRSA